MPDPNEGKSRLSVLFNRFSSRVTEITGKPVSFFTALFIILAWAVSGPIFGYSDTWQLVINTGTTIITFLMVFVIQQSQNKDTLALQLKLNELLASSRFASNSLVDIEDLTDEELKVIKKYYITLAKMSKKELNVHASHSLDEAEQNDKHKRQARTGQGKPIANRQPHKSQGEKSPNQRNRKQQAKKDNRDINDTQALNKPGK